MQNKEDFPVTKALCDFFDRNPAPFYRSCDVGAALFCVLGACAIVGVSVSTEWAIATLFRYAKKCRRRGFYAREVLRNPSRKIRVRTTRSTHIPTPEEVVAQWELAKHRNNNLEKLRLGAMLADIESTVDNDLVRDEYGDIVGRHPGLKGWFRSKCRTLLPHYKTLMRYKSMADKLQTISGLKDPDPVLVVLPDHAPKTEKRRRGKRLIENSAERLQHVEKKCVEEMKRKVPRWAKEKRFEDARKRVEKMLERPRTLHGLENELFLSLGILREKRPRESGYVRVGHRNRMKKVSA